MNVARSDTEGQIFQPIGSAHVRALHKHFFSSFNIQVILHFDSCLISDVLLHTDESRSLQGAGAEHFVLAEDFEGGDRDAGDGNRVA